MSVSASNDPTGFAGQCKTNKNLASGDGSRRGWAVTVALVAAGAKAREPATSANAARPSSRSGGKFVHPGIYHNAADLSFMRKKIVPRAEPWFSAFTAF